MLQTQNEYVLQCRVATVMTHNPSHICVVLDGYYYQTWKFISFFRGKKWKPTDISVYITSSKNGCWWWKFPAYNFILTSEDYETTYTAVREKTLQ
jgi:hypothetical protein